jgi:hypothetical protein
MYSFRFFCSSVYCYVKTECGSELSAGIRGALSHVKKKTRRDAALAAHRALSLLEIEVEAGWSGPRRSCLAWRLFGRRGVWISPGTRRRDSGQLRAPSAAPICPCVIRTSGTQPLALAGRRALQGALARCAHDPNRTADCFPVPCRPHGCRIGRALATFMNDAPPVRCLPNPVATVTDGWGRHGTARAPWLALLCCVAVARARAKQPLPSPCNGPTATGGPTARPWCPRMGEG